MKKFFVSFALLGCWPAGAQTYFAEIDATNIVLRVVVADEAFISSGALGSRARWRQTGASQKVYAGPGFSYNALTGDFTPPQPFASWLFDAVAKTWVAPLPAPDSRTAKWDEKTLSWK